MARRPASKDVRRKLDVQQDVHERILDSEKRRKLKNATDVANVYGKEILEVLDQDQIDGIAARLTLRENTYDVMGFVKPEYQKTGKDYFDNELETVEVDGQTTFKRAFTDHELLLDAFRDFEFTEDIRNIIGYDENYNPLPPEYKEGDNIPSPSTKEKDFALQFEAKPERISPYEDLSPPIHKGASTARGLQILKALQQFGHLIGVDEKAALGGRIGMNTGGVPSYRDDSMQELTQDEYQRRFVNFYDPVRISAPVAPAAGDDDTTPPPAVTQGSVLDLVGDDSGRTILDFNFESGNTGTYIVNYDKREAVAKEGAKQDLSGKFEQYFSGPQAKATTALGAGLGIITGFGPVAGAGLQVMAQLNRKQHYKNAQAIEAQGGGSFFTLDGQTISRAPGSRNYVGTTGNYTQSQIAGIDAIQNGFLPGSMITDVVSGPGGTGNDGHMASHTHNKIQIDAFGTYHSYAGVNQLGASAAADARRSEFNTAVDAAKAQGYSIPAGMTDVTFKQQLDAVMKGKHAPSTGFTFSSIRMDKNLNNQLAIDRIKEGIKLLTGGSDKDDTSTTVKPTPINIGPDDRGTQPTATVANTAASENVNVPKGSGDDDDTSRGISQSGFQGGFDRGAVQESTSQTQSNYEREAFGGGGMGGGFDSFRASGGRVGLQEGGVAAAPAGFVERPPSQVSEAATVADDKPMSVPEGTFVINAAAVEFAGEKDIMEMLNVAYKKAEKKGIQPPSEEMLEVAVSKGEVIVPAFLAKIIGYDRLEKINNRGKKETNERIKENGQRPVEAAGGGFLARKKFAEGDTVTPPVLPKPDKPITPPVRKPLSPRQEALKMADEELRMDLEEFIKDDNLAKLGWDLFTSGDLRLMGMPVPRGTLRTNFAGTFYPPKGKDTMPTFPQGSGYSETEKAQREEVRTASEAGYITKSIADKLGIVLDSDMPTATYFAEPMHIDEDNRTDINKFKSDRAGVFVTLAHELRHAALNHLKFDYGVRELTLSGEENLMDYFDYKARRTASKSNPLVSETPLRKSAKSRTKLASYSKFNKKMYDEYNKVAGVLLEERGYLMPEEEKGFVTKFMDRLVSAPRPGGSELRESKGKPVDYEAQAYLQ